MKNLSFVIWMMGWQLIIRINSYLYFLEKGNHEFGGIDAIVALIELFIWIYVGTLVYEKKE